MKFAAGLLCAALCLHAAAAHPPPVASKKLTEVATPAQRVCPEGYRLEHHGCLKEESVPASVRRAG